MLLKGIPFSSFATPSSPTIRVHKDQISFNLATETGTTLKGQNLIGNNSGSAIAEAPGLIGTFAAPIDPRLSPLGHYGGPTQTRHPLANSPAILTNGPATIRTDQRGFTLNGSPTIGAVKLGPIFTVENYPR